VVIQTQEQDNQNVKRVIIAAVVYVLHVMARHSIKMKQVKQVVRRLVLGITRAAIVRRHNVQLGIETAQQEHHHKAVVRRVFQQGIML
jgi:hypothetical protein